MNLSIEKRMSWVLLATMMAGCGGMPGDDKEPAPSDQQPAAAKEAPSPGGAPTPTTTAIEQQAGKQLSDPAFNGMIPMGSRQGWSVYLDKATNQAVATDGMSSVTFDPSNLDEATVGSLVKMGIPEELLWSWKGVLCRAACWAAGGVGCAAVAGTCAFGTVVTIGGFALPCTVAVLAACGAAAGGASVCSDWCTHKYG